VTARSEVDAEQARDYLEHRDRLNTDARPKPNEYEDDPRDRWRP
jgi:hypothetical protein